MSDVIRELFDLSGKKALVTGAGRGIGRTLALALAGAGADVAVMDIDEATAARTADEIRALGRKSFSTVADVRVPGDVDRAFDEAARELGGLDVAVNNAGVCIHEPAENVSKEHLDFVVDVDFKGVFFCCQAAGRIMIPNKRGSIINIASMSGTAVNVPQRQASYNASKAAVMQLTKSLAVEWGEHGVRVNSISPGYVKTEMTAMVEHMFAEWSSYVPLKRLAEMAELRGLVIYLASDASSYMTGSDVIIDGGYTAR